MCKQEQATVFHTSKLIRLFPKWTHGTNSKYEILQVARGVGHSLGVCASLHKPLFFIHQSIYCTCRASRAIPMHGEIQYLVSLQLDGCAIKGCHHDPDARSSSLLFDQHSMLRGSFNEHWSKDFGALIYSRSTTTRYCRSHR